MTLLIKEGTTPNNSNLVERPQRKYFYQTIFDGAKVSNERAAR